MDKNTIDKTFDTLNNVSKIAANLSEKKEKPVVMKETPRNSDDSNRNASSQNISIQLDSGKKKEPKPIEKHIHTFPEQRALTEQECELALKQSQMEYDMKKSQLEFARYVDQRNWDHQMEVEKKNAKRGRIRSIIACVLGAASIGSIGYGIWADYRDHKNSCKAPALPAAEPVKAEGSVE